MERENKSYLIVWFTIAAISGLLWLTLIGLKYFGLVSVGWITVLLGVWWIPLSLLAIGLTAGLTLIAFGRVRSQIGRTKRPKPLAGKALDHAAWNDYKIKRKPGETDEQLRRRCMTEADNEYANSGRW